MAVNSRPLKGNNKAAEKIASLVDMDVDLRFGGRKEILFLQLHQLYLSEMLILLHQVIKKQDFLL